MRTPERDFEFTSMIKGDITDHLTFLYFIVKEKKLKNVLELGVYRGYSTKALLQAVVEIGGKMTSVDILNLPKIQTWVKDKGFDSYWTFIQNNDLMIDWEEGIDLLFIDSSHKLQHTKDELLKFVPFVKHGGYIIMHDFNHPKHLKAINQAVDEYFVKDPRYEFYRFYHNNGLLVVKFK